MNRNALAVYSTLVILVSAIYLPMLFDKIFMDKVEKTHLFYSPVSRDFILQEKIVGKIPEAAKGFAFDHHSSLAYVKAGGIYVDRHTFERHLPFIYYKNNADANIVDTVIRAVVLDNSFSPVKRYTHTMSRATATPAILLKNILFPFTLAMGPTPNSGYVKLRLIPGTPWSFAGMGTCALLFAGGTILFTGQRPRVLRIAVVALAGVYGLIAMFIATISD